MKYDRFASMIAFVFIIATPTVMADVVARINIPQPTPTEQVPKLASTPMPHFTPVSQQIEDPNPIHELMTIPAPHIERTPIPIEIQLSQPATQNPDYGANGAISVAISVLLGAAILFLTRKKILLQQE